MISESFFRNTSILFYISTFFQGAQISFFFVIYLIESWKDGNRNFSHGTQSINVNFYAVKESIGPAPAASIDSSSSSSFFSYPSRCIFPPFWHHSSFSFLRGDLVLLIVLAIRVQIISHKSHTYTRICMYVHTWDFTTLASTRTQPTKKRIMNS